jgi:hypothetical protein
MRLTSGTFAAVLALAGCALAAQKNPPPAKPGRADPPAGNAPAQPKGGPLTAESGVDEILDALDARGRNLKSFRADVSLAEIDAAIASEVTRRGQALYQDQGDGQARLRVTFVERDTGTRVFDEKIEYLLQGGWLTDRDYERKVEVRRQVLREGEKLDLLKLGEGPFPLPIGQKKEDVHAQFEVAKVKPAKDDPPGSVHIRLTPKPDSQFARKFDEIDVWVDTKTNMPARIETAQGESVRSTELTKFTANPEPALKDADFALPKIDGWDRHEEPFND